MIPCKWNHSINPSMNSDNENFIWINGLRIFNYRFFEDYCHLGDISFEGMII